MPTHHEQNAKVASIIESQTRYPDIQKIPVLLLTPDRSVEVNSQGPYQT